MRPLAACGVLAPVVFTAAWVAATLLQDDYSARREDISGLAARTAEHPWVMVAGLCATGVLLGAFAVGLHRGVGRGSVVGPALVLLTSVGIVTLGVLRNDCSSLTPACEARVEAGDVSWQHTAHDLVSVPVFATAIAAPVVLALRFRRHARWRSLVPFSVAASFLLGAFLALGGLDGPWSGVLQRVAVSVAFLWVEVVALRLPVDM